MGRGRNQYRSYTSAEKMEALKKLAENGGNAKRTSKELNIPLTTIITWKNSHYSEYAGLKERTLDTILDEIWESVKQLVDRNVIQKIIEQATKEGKIKDVVAAAAILIDKGLVLSNVKASLVNKNQEVEEDISEITSEEQINELIEKEAEKAKDEANRKKRRDKDRIVR